MDAQRRHLQDNLDGKVATAPLLQRLRELTEWLLFPRRRIRASGCQIGTVPCCVHSSVLGMETSNERFQFHCQFDEEKKQYRSSYCVYTVVLRLDEKTTGDETWQSLVRYPFQVVTQPVTDSRSVVSQLGLRKRPLHCSLSSSFRVPLPG
jgi:hypothetical protein